MLVHVVYVSSRLEIMHFVVWYMTQGNIHRRLLPLTRAMLRRFFFYQKFDKITHVGVSWDAIMQ